MFKSSRMKVSALAALVFGVAMSFGASATFQNNGPCWACHTACDDARLACVASGTGGCFPAYRACTANCANAIPGCQIP
jgi:hypothetical protein